RSGTRQGCPLSPLLFNIVLEVLASAIRQQNKIKGIQIGKEEVKLSLFKDDIILYMENLEDSTRWTFLIYALKSLEILSGYKVFILWETFSSSLYTNNKVAEREVKKIIPFAVASTRVRYLGINFTKEVKDLFSANCKTLIEAIKDNKNKWKDLPCSWIERINILKMPMLLKAIYRLNA
ncbi:LORF2 protein, partial [Crocuta crocuta]